MIENLEVFMSENEISLRLFSFLSIFFIIAILEYFIPRRGLLISKSKRWFNNIFLVIIDTFIVKLLFPIVAVGTSIYAAQKEIGLFNVLDFSPIYSIIFCIIILDFIIYWQHRLFHKMDFLWRFHKVHHCDLDYDVTTALRFHPIEIIISMCIKIFFVLLLGAPLIAVILFEILLNALAMFNHSNIKITKSIDTFLRYFLVTPDMHRIHHSILNQEHNSNYGFNISFWDRLFGSYTKEPKENYATMQIGLNNLQDEKKTVSIFAILKLPFLHLS
ncbi:sterol desaturase family protein [Sulfurospirillum sp.]|nr:sterol desaturase family protein [Sulfurospirillum sp.]